MNINRPRNIWIVYSKYEKTVLYTYTYIFSKNSLYLAKALSRSLKKLLSDQPKEKREISGIDTNVIIVFPFSVFSNT
jgi:hypothetical protein